MHVSGPTDGPPEKGRVGETLAELARRAETLAGQIREACATPARVRESTSERASAGIAISKAIQLVAAAVADLIPASWSAAGAPHRPQLNALTGALIDLSKELSVLYGCD